jgi:Raf kinase inhibitor-like YbhB/YbcL family protein
MKGQSNTLQERISPMAIRITSPAFEHNGPIPQRFAGRGEGLSPPLQWEGQPVQARQLALIVDDPDAPGPTPWVHWLIYNIPPEVRGLPEGVLPTEHPAKPTDTAQGKNSWEALGYGGPAPPAGDGPHHYRFRIFALDVEPTLAPGLSRDELQDAITGHILEQGELVGVHETQS